MSILAILLFKSSPPLFIILLGQLAGKKTTFQKIRCFVFLLPAQKPANFGENLEDKIYPVKPS